MNPDYLLCAATIIAKRAQAFPLEAVARQTVELAVALQDEYQRRTVLVGGRRVVAE